MNLDITAVGTMAHAYILSFTEPLEVLSERYKDLTSDRLKNHTYT